MTNYYYYHAGNSPADFTEEQQVSKVIQDKRSRRRLKALELIARSIKWLPSTLEQGARNLSREIEKLTQAQTLANAIAVRGKNAAGWGNELFLLDRWIYRAFKDSVLEEQNEYEKEWEEYLESPSINKDDYLYDYLTGGYKKKK